MAKVNKKYGRALRRTHKFPLFPNLSNNVDRWGPITPPTIHTSNLKPPHPPKIARDPIWQTPDTPDSSAEDAAVQVEEAKQYYDIVRNGRKGYTITRRMSADDLISAWDDLNKVPRVELKGWTFATEESIQIKTHNDENDAFAVVREIGDLEDGRFVMLVLWYCSRDELKDRGCSNMKDWPRGCSLMLSTHMDVLMWDAANGEMDEEARQKVAKEQVVDMCRSGPAKIYPQNHRFLRWMWDKTH